MGPIEELASFMVVAREFCAGSSLLLQLTSWLMSLIPDSKLQLQVLSTDWCSRIEWPSEETKQTWNLSNDFLSKFICCSLLCNPCKQGIPSVDPITTAISAYWETREGVEPYRLTSWAAGVWWQFRGWSHSLSYWVSTVMPCTILSAPFSRAMLRKTGKEIEYTKLMFLRHIKQSWRYFYADSTCLPR